MLPVIPSRMCLSFNMEAGGLRPFGSVLRLRALLEEKLAVEELLGGDDRRFGQAFVVARDFDLLAVSKVSSNVSVVVENSASLRLSSVFNSAEIWLARRAMMLTVS